MPTNHSIDDDFFNDLYDEPQPAVEPVKIAPTTTHINYTGVSHSGDQKPLTGDKDDKPASTAVKAGETPAPFQPVNAGEKLEDGDVDFTPGNTSTFVSSVSPEANSEGQQFPRQAAPPGSVHDCSRPPQTVLKPTSKEEGKMFIGGLNWGTTDQSLRQYFSKFDEVTDCTVMRDPSGRSRGFGFVTFKDPRTVNVVMVKEHFLDGKIIDPKRAIPREEQEKTSKIFVGGVSHETTDKEFKDYFAQFGRVVDATLMIDKDTGRPRGFGFVTFESDAGVEACLRTSLAIHGKSIEVKKAQPRGMRDDDESARPMGRASKGKFGTAHGGSSAAAGPENMSAFHDGQGDGINPQTVAQMCQRVQQMMAMQQLMMACGGGAPVGVGMNPGINPAVWSRLSMQQMMMDRGDGGGMNYNLPATGDVNPGASHGQHLEDSQRGPAWTPNFRSQAVGPGNDGPLADAPAAPKNAGRPETNFYRGGSRGGRFHPYPR